MRLANSPHLSASQLQAELARRPGLVPIWLDTGRKLVWWADLSTWHCFDGFFHQSLTAYEAVLGRPADQFLTSSEVLLQPALVEDNLQPNVFIFHAGRCGSTLLARFLARCRNYSLLSEAAPHNQIWDWMPDTPADMRQNLYRNLIAATGRRRIATHSALIVKFTSYNILHFAAIRAAYPEVPALFLFRQPDAIIASYRREPPAWKCDDPTQSVEEFFRQAAAVREPGFRRLNLSSLTADNMPRLLRYFGLDPDPISYRQMLEEFAFDPKPAGRRVAFEPRGAKPEPAHAGLQSLYGELVERESEDWREPTSCIMR